MSGETEDGIRLTRLTRDERHQLDSIASRHVEIRKGTADADMRSPGRLHADVSHLLRMIGGPYARLAERL